MSDASGISLSFAGAAPGPLLSAAVDFPIGTPVYQVIGAGTFTVSKAEGSALTVARCIGIASQPGKAGLPVHVAGANTLLTLTISQWEVISANDGDGLIPGSAYYLSAATAGLLVTTLPVATGNIGVQVGIALSPTCMLIQIMPGLVAHA